MVSAVTRFNPDLLVLDDTLGLMNGKEVAHAIRGKFFHPDIILLTGYVASFSQLERMMPYGVVNLFEKVPQVEEELAARITQLRQRKLGANISSSAPTADEKIEASL